VTEDKIFILIFCAISGWLGLMAALKHRRIDE
jgi:hypothetical protein